MNHSTEIIFQLEPNDNDRLASLCGYLDENFRLIEKRINIEIRNLGHRFTLIGEQKNIQIGRDLLEALYQETASQKVLTVAQIHLTLQEHANLLKVTIEDNKQASRVIKTRRGVIKPRGKNQKQYVEAILNHDISFGIGPAGTGKTYLAVACAVDALERQEVRRIILTRPAVEAGERLGFLPGDMAQKVDPYLRPLYDALYEMLGFERVAKLMERHVIEVAPLAYMRGRTLNEAFIILDESQNTTSEQMKMLLTRIGFNSKAVVTGDLTQIDLPRGKLSGLKQATEVLNKVNQVHFTFFEAEDVVRHPVVQSVVKAYEKYDRDNEASPQNKETLHFRNEA